jgi:hypothetical protein
VQQQTLSVMWHCDLINNPRTRQHPKHPTLCPKSHIQNHSPPPRTHTYRLFNRWLLAVSNKAWFYT